MGAAGVVLLHGIARSGASMSRLARVIQAAGFQTLTVDYPSRTLALAELADHVHRRVERFVARAGPVHFVTHSMGGLVARAYIHRYRPPELGRVVMLGPPNQGSEIADLLSRRWAYRRFFGPAGGQLGTHRDAALIEALGRVDYPVGVVAGDRALFLLAWLLIPGRNDGRVSVVRTKVEGMTDHVAVHATHSFMTRNATVARLTVEFLRHGRFHALTGDPAPMTRVMVGARSPWGGGGGSPG